MCKDRHNKKEIQKYINTHCLVIIDNSLCKKMEELTVEVKFDLDISLPEEELQFKDVTEYWHLFLYGNAEYDIAGLIDISSDKYGEELPGIKLLCAIIARMGEDGNKNYFKSLAFRQHCWWLRLKSKDVLKMVEAIWSKK